MTKHTLFITALLSATLTAQAADARLTHLVVETREAAVPARAAAPAYTILHGYYDGELDPRDSHNRIITDISAAPRLPNGRVGYRATFALSMPTDPTRSSGFLVYDVPNRGNGTVAADANGHIQVISGWQGDIDAPGAQTIVVPIARGSRGKPLTGSILQRFTNVPAGSTSIPIAGGLGRPTPRPLPLSLDVGKARLTRQASDTENAVLVAGSDWAFADCRTTPFPGRPDPTQLCLRDGFDTTQAYTLTYTAKDPRVLGIGFAAVRDLNAFLRSGDTDDSGLANPVAGMVRWPIATGTSQSGNFIRSFIALGFNQAEDGRRVFDGANPNIAARLLPLNVRFGLPGGAASAFEAGSEGTLWWGRYNDRARGRGVSSLLDRCRATTTCPKIVETFGSAEFWGLRMSPDLVGTDAAADIPLPPEVRRYYFPSVTHGGSYTGGFPLKGEPLFPGAPACRMPGNPNPSSDTRRAVLKMLADWVGIGKTPAASRYPTLASGDLVVPKAKAIGWPVLAGSPSPDGKLNDFVDQDFGKTFGYHDLSGVITQQPPRIRGIMPSRVPRVNSDGNETAGVPSVQLLVPLGTYTGWNEQAEGYGKGGGCGFFGGFIPFARTAAERNATGDPRPSLTERYRDHAGFIARVRDVAAKQVAEGWLLSEDAQRIVSQADDSDVLR